MSQAAVAVMRARSHDRESHGSKPKLNSQEYHALELMRREAKRKGVELENDGEGGLPPGLVLRVMRRDKYKCKAHGGRDKPISVHHKGGIVDSEWLSQKGHHNDENNLVTICVDCHNKLHNEARSKGTDSSQVKPSGDDYKGQHGH